MTLKADGQVNKLTVVELNVENLFDTQHDSLKNDYEFLPDSERHWSRTRYWRKLNRLGQTLISCGEDSAGWTLPDLVGLCEVENDTVMRDLTKRSLLRKARYEYVMTDSPDERGIDVALLYSPFSFRLLTSYGIRINPIHEMKPTRDILYAAGELASGDTLHVMVVHAPSRSGGELATRPFRLHVARKVCQSVDSIKSVSPDAKILVMGDFNAYSGEPSLEVLKLHGLTDVSQQAVGLHGAKGSYCYQGRWGSLDHLLLSDNMRDGVEACLVHDPVFLLVEDTKYGGVKPRRNFLGPRFLDGFSDHLPLLLRLFLVVGGNGKAS